MCSQAKPPHATAEKLGTVTLSVAGAAWAPGSPLPEVQTLALDGKSGGSICVRAILVDAPPSSAPIRTLVGTWNVGNAHPADDLSTWLRNEGQSAEVVAVGAQECTYEPRAHNATCEADWLATLLKTLGRDYGLVRISALGQMRLAIFVRFDVRAGLHGHESGSEATGLGHVGSNKGGVCTVMHLWDTSLCFVNSHLAAHQNFVERRNSDYCEIAASPNLVLGEPGMDIMSQFHHVVWMGDLNYRLDLSPLFGEAAAKAKTPPAELFDSIIASVESADFSSLAKCDQLTAEIAAGNAFVGFSEGALTHAPTFKVKRAEGLVYDKKRSPAYCDRVLWRSLAAAGVSCSQEALWSAPLVASSDHKPVATLLLLGRRAPRPSWVPRPELAKLRESAVSKLPSTIASKTQLRTWRLKLVALTGHGLTSADFSGLSDPYILFSGASLPRMLNTPYVPQTLDPIWPPDQLPLLTLCAASEEELCSEVIHVQVMDFDAFSQNDPIGNGALSLGPLVRDALQGGGEAAFEVPIHFEGKDAGCLKGRVLLDVQAATMSVREFLAAKRKLRIPAPSKGFWLSRLFSKPNPTTAVRPRASHHLPVTRQWSAYDDEDDDDDGPDGASRRLASMRIKAINAPKPEEEEEDATTAPAAPAAAAAPPAAEEKSEA